MNRINFTIAKLLCDEDRLATQSDKLQDVYDELRGKTVAVVGNARSLSQTEFGRQIDRADTVVRINSSPIPDPQSHGLRTTWVATSIPIPAEIINVRSPQRVLWMTAKRKRLPWALVARSGFYMHSADRHHELIADTGCRPTTGLLVLDLLRRAPVCSVNIFGFDFFTSLSLSGSRTSAQVPHDFDAERIWVENLLDNDCRFDLMV